MGVSILIGESADADAAALRPDRSAARFRRRDWEARQMKFHRLTAVIVLTGVWAVIVLVVGEDFFGSHYRPDGFWDRYIKTVALGAVGLWVLVYFISSAEKEDAEKPVALLEYRPGIRLSAGPTVRLDRLPRERSTRNALVVRDQTPQTRRLPLSIKSALVATGLWALLMFIAVRDIGFHLGLYLLVTLPTGLLVFVVVDAIGRTTGWMVADRARGWTRSRRALRTFLWAFLWFVLYVILVGAARTMFR
jgi:hypothetical protein